MMVSAAKSEKPITLALVLHRDTRGEPSILVSLDGDRRKAVNLPRSLIADYELVDLSRVRVTVPEWLAHDRGLLTDAEGMDDMFDAFMTNFEAEGRR